MRTPQSNKYCKNNNNNNNNNNKYSKNIKKLGRGQDCKNTKGSGGISTTKKSKALVGSGLHFC